MQAKAWQDLRSGSGLVESPEVKVFELMSAYKRRYRFGQVVWFYQFDGISSTREERVRITESGFSTKREAEDAEANRRIEEQRKRDMAKASPRFPKRSRCSWRSSSPNTWTKSSHPRLSSATTSRHRTSIQNY